MSFIYFLLIRLQISAELVSEEYWIHIDFARQHGRSIAVLLLPVAKIF